MSLDNLFIFAPIIELSVKVFDTTERWKPVLGKFRGYRCRML